MSLIFVVEKTQLTAETSRAFKRVFEDSFPRENWRASVPYKRDTVYAAYRASDRELIGFAMTHDAPPEPFPGNPGRYLYNLCVTPVCRGSGVATAIVDAAARDGTLHTHALLTNKRACEWFAKRGFRRCGTWRGVYAAFTISGSVKHDHTVKLETVGDDVRETLRHWDPIENVIYLQPRF